MDEDELGRLIMAMGVRIVRVPALNRACILLREHELALVDDDLSPRDRQQVLDLLLQHVVADLAASAA